MPTVALSWTAPWGGVSGPREDFGQRWRDYVSELVWERHRILPEELEEPCVELTFAEALKTLNLLENTFILSL